MNKIRDDLQELVSIYDQLHKKYKDKLIRYGKAIASMDETKTAEFQKLANRAKQLKSEDDYDSFIEHVHEYAERIATGDAAKEVWLDWCDVREAEELASIDALNKIFHETTEKILTQPLDGTTPG